MSAGVPVTSARRTVTLTAAEMEDTDGVRASLATSVGTITMLPADFVSANMDTTTGAFLKLPRSVTITLSSSAGSYTTDDIVITGKRGTSTVTETLTPTTANGGETLRGTQIFDSITSIAIPAQVNTSGAWTVGFQDVAAPVGMQFVGIRMNAASGTLNLGYGSLTDAVPGVQNYVEPIAFERVLTSSALSSPTTVGVTLYLN